MRMVQIGSVTLGEGMPKICVPVMGADMEEIAAAALRARQAQGDLIELRIDSLSSMPDAQTAIAACRTAREQSGLPVLFTLRTQRDGGAGSADAAAYEALLARMANSGACEAIDCELSAGREAFSRIAQEAHRCGVVLVGSSHEFGHIGDVRRAGQWLLEQQELGADICKAAVMTHSRVEALGVMLEMARAQEALTVPCIAITMGEHGVISRVCCQSLGSCLTFAAAGRASAPGQLDAKELRATLEMLAR